MSTISTIIFREHASAPLGQRFFSLFPGLGYAAGYKVTQRIYKYGGQPFFNDVLSRNYKTSFTNAFGERKGKLMMQATAGRWVFLSLYSIEMPRQLISLFFFRSLTGIGEVVRRPLTLFSRLFNLETHTCAFIRSSSHLMFWKLKDKSIRRLSVVEVSFG